MTKEKFGTYVGYNSEDPKLEEEDVQDLRKWFNDCMEVSGQTTYEETIPLREDGHLSTEERIGKTSSSFLMTLFRQVRKTAEGDIESRGLDVEEFYNLIQVLQEKLPEFEFKVEEDPKERKWIRYKVTRK